MTPQIAVKFNDGQQVQYDLAKDCSPVQVGVTPGGEVLDADATPMLVIRIADGGTERYVLADVEVFEVMT
jgi:hypothetical protein